MPSISVPKLLQEAGQVREALEKIDKPLPGGVSVKAATEAISSLNSAVSKLDNLNAEKSRLVNQKTGAARFLRDFITKARLAIKVECGDDSSEYEMAGGTRKSERKKPIRKPKPTAGA
jgi:hypothetical protein